MDALYLLDGYSLVYRSYFAMIRSPLMNPRGRNSSAIHGFFRSLFALLADRRPSHFAVVLDSTTPTFRHERYAEYKATREKTPEDLRNEIPVIEEILSVLGVPTLRVNGYEADDVMATLATRAAAEGRPCFVVSGDKDLLQLVDGPVMVLKPESGGGLSQMDRSGVIEQWGVTPQQMLDYLALVGDTSDNVPGVKGVGAKTAAALLGEFGTLEGIYEHLDSVSSKSWREKLQAGRESAWLSRDLIRLHREVPLDRSIDDLELPELDTARAAVYFAAEGMRSLVRELTGSEQASTEDKALTERALVAADRRLQGWIGAPGATLGPSGAVEEPDHGGGRGAPTGGGSDAHRRPAAQARPARYAFERDPKDAEPGAYELVDTEEKLDRWCARAREAGLVAFDSETTSLDAMRAEPVGFSLSTERGSGCYIPLHGPDGPVLAAQLVRPRLAAILENPEVRVIGQNLTYDYKVAARWGVTIANPWFDTMVAAWLLDTEGGGFGMDALAEEYLGYRTVRYDDVVPATPRGEEPNTFDVVPLEAATRYAAEDADVTFRLYRVFERLLAERGLSDLFFSVEMKLLPVLARMEMEGIRLNADELERYSIELEAELGRIEREIYALCGREFNIASTRQLQEVLFTERKLTPSKKTKTGYSTDTSVLEELAAEDPVPALVLRHRTLAKLKSTYVDSLPGMVNPSTGRIHTHYNLTGTATGRISSNDPNLQNIPIRDEEGRRIRSAFVPREGWRFVSADYSQIELVVLAHLADDPGLKRAFAEGVDVHRHTGSLIFGVPLDEVTAQQRRIAKTINFGVVFGMSAFRLSRDLQIPRRDADAFLEAYFSTYSRIKGFIDETVARAEEQGYVETILGRKRYLANITNRNRTVKMAAERVAVNTPIQGSAADVMKLAMVDLAARLAERALETRLILQVHDELILEAPPGEVDEVKELVARVMTGAYTLSIPLKVSVESGTSWGEMH